MSAPPPSLLFEFDGALTSFETYQVTGFNSPLNSDSHSSKPVVIITELERDGRLSSPTIAAISADLTLSGGNLIWGRSWHGLGEDVQVAIFRGRRHWLERGGITMGGYFPSRAPCIRLLGGETVKLQSGRKEQRSPGEEER